VAGEPADQRPCRVYLDSTRGGHSETTDGGRSRPPHAWRCRSERDGAHVHALTGRAPTGHHPRRRREFQETVTAPTMNDDELRVPVIEDDAAA